MPKAVPCKDFMEGHCPYGDYCSFLQQVFCPWTYYILSDMGIAMKSHKKYHLPMMNPPIQGIASPGLRLTSSLLRARLFTKIPLSLLSESTLKSLTNLDQVIFQLLRTRFPRPQFEFITPEKLSQFPIQSAQCPLLISLR